MGCFLGLEGYCGIHLLQVVVKGEEGMFVFLLISPFTLFELREVVFFAGTLPSLLPSGRANQAAQKLFVMSGACLPHLVGTLWRRMWL